MLFLRGLSQIPDHITTASCHRIRGDKIRVSYQSGALTLPSIQDECRKKRFPKWAWELYGPDLKSRLLLTLTSHD